MALSGFHFHDLYILPEQKKQQQHKKKPRTQNRPFHQQYDKLAPSNHAVYANRL